MRTIFYLLSIITFSGCTKESPTRWDTRVNAPLGYGELTLNDIITDSLLQENGDGTISLRYKETLLEMNVDSIYTFLPDTIQRSWNLPISFTASPNVTLFTQDEPFNFSDDDASLTFAELNQGKIKFVISNELDTDVVFRYVVPKAIRMGEPLSVEILVPASHDGLPGQIDFEFDISGYQLDLTGESGNTFNMLETSFRILTPDNGQQALISPNKNISLAVIYSDFGIEYAQGYFNTTSINLADESTYFAGLSELNGAILDLSSARANLTFTNYFGADLRAILTNFTSENSTSGLNVTLENSVFGTPLNLSRSIQLNNTIEPSVLSIEFDDDNSNISSFLEILGDSLDFTGSVILNPLGNISNYNDFISGSGNLTVDLDMEIPLEFSISNLVLRDTLSINSNEETLIAESGVIYVHCKNSFPMDVRLEIMLIGIDETPLLNMDQYLVNTHIAMVSGRQPSESDAAWSILKYNLGPGTIESISTAGSFVITATFQSTDYPNHVTIAADEKIEILISSELELPIELK